MSKPLHIISLGAGVQSSTMALMAAAGDIEPMPDAAIFCDTMAEPKKVYEWLDWLENQLPFPVYRVTKGDLTADQLKVHLSKKSGKNYIKGIIPTYVSSGGFFGRKCTSDYKITPYRRKARELAGIFGKQCDELRVITWLGISLDEIQRMKVSIDNWQEYRHPLIEKRMHRYHCLRWMKARGYEEPPRSACIYCPFHSSQDWREIKESPDEWSKVVQFERELQALCRTEVGDRFKGLPYLHSSCKPIDQVDFDRPEDKGQINWLDECEGMCGI